MSKTPGEIIIEQAEEIKKLKEQIDKAVAFEYGEKLKKIRVEKKEDKWVLVNAHKGVLNKRDQFRYDDYSNSKKFSRDDALKEAEKKAK
jgi:pyruvate kinase